ncbi:hypothetical protein CHS0354_009139 [Potamilus streckersoni]|uniref:Neurotransmitter-gated ion-channel ligand-binding domain-containing protein n=1 Tax=Potamilus streckersoni TaxID=2493646 RepID=A0AAE0W0J5_9BIVA|nr:hypothetical protein CHS0354_009139 [Potamilus streckersoni]
MADVFIQVIDKLKQMQIVVNSLSQSPVELDVSTGCHFPATQSNYTIPVILLQKNIWSWLADIGVINDDNLQLIVTSTGDVVWEPPGIYTTHCDIDVTYYPFDRQQCVIELTSWSMTKDQLELDHLSSIIDTEDFR